MLILGRNRLGFLRKAFEVFEAEMFIRTNLKVEMCLQILCEFMLYFKVTFQSVIDPDDMGTHLRILSGSYPMITNMTGFSIVFKNLGTLALGKKVAPAWEGLSWVLLEKKCSGQKNITYLFIIQYFFFWAPGMNGLILSVLKVPLLCGSCLHAVRVSYCSRLSYCLNGWR